jgi:predicted transcriptional regulator
MARKNALIEAVIRLLWARPAARAEIKRRVKAKFGIDITTIKQLLDLLVEYGPKLIAIIAEVLKLFS